MRYSIVCRDDKKSIQAAKELKMGINLEYNEDEPDLVIAVGGDGTILRAAHQYINRIDDIIFFGINTGHLGFYTNFDSGDFDKLIKSINDNDFYNEEYSLIEYRLNGKIGYALNEITIVNFPQVVVIDLKIDSEQFETFRGSGICISTTNGSTAHNKSLGGPVVDPKLDALVLTEIASINSNAYRTLGSSLVLSSKRKLVLKCMEPCILTADQNNYKVGKDIIECCISSKKIKFAVVNGISYFKRVKKSFL